jgi:hypothetical protein
MLMVLAITPMAAGAGNGPASDERFLLPARDDLRVQVIKPFATLKPGRGVELSFVAMRDAEGRATGVTIAQSTASGWSGLSDISALHAANPLQIFYALSKPGAKVPLVLMKLYGQPDGTQGWARGQIVHDGGTSGYDYSCQPGTESFNSFDNEILAKGYAGVFLSEKDGPSSKPSHWFDYNPGDGTEWYQLRGGVDRAKAFYAKVQYCFVDNNYNGAFEADPRVRISSRWSVLGPFAELDSMSLTNPGDELEVFSFPGDGEDYDYRLEITLARPMDMFHIGATWSKPGYIAPNN